MHPLGPAGVVVSACMYTEVDRNTGSPIGEVRDLNWTPARGRPGRVGWRRGP
jgi:hypothetical protein